MLLLQKNRRGDYCNNLCRVMVLTFCTSSDDILLSMYRVLFISLLYFQRYAPDKLNIAKIRKGSNSMNTGDRVMVIAFCDSPHCPLSVYQVSFNSLLYFQRYASDKLLLQKFKKEVTL